MSQPRLRAFEIWLPLAVVVLDQATKALVRARLPIHESATVIPGMLDVTHIRNTGAAFGILSTIDFPFKTMAIAIIASIALLGVALYTRSISQDQWLARAGLSLILGGAAGNLIDRLMIGSVVDFVDVYWRDYHFWAFNVADSAITVGVGLMILDMLRTGTHASDTP